MLRIQSKKGFLASQFRWRRKRRKIISLTDSFYKSNRVRLWKFCRLTDFSKKGPKALRLGRWCWIFLQFCNKVCTGFVGAHLSKKDKVTISCQNEIMSKWNYVKMTLCQNHKFKNEIHQNYYKNISLIQWATKKSFHHQILNDKKSNQFDITYLRAFFCMFHYQSYSYPACIPVFSG